MNDLKSRLEAKIVKTGDCWIWGGTRNTQNYASIIVNGKFRPAHRIAYELAKGEIPPKYVIDHLCRTPACINPDHLEAVSHRENVIRGLTSALRPDNLCRSKLHEMDDANSRWYYDNRINRRCRSCKKCARIARLKKAAKDKAIQQQLKGRKNG